MSTDSVKERLVRIEQKIEDKLSQVLTKDQIKITLTECFIEHEEKAAKSYTVLDRRITKVERRQLRIKYYISGFVASLALVWSMFKDHFKHLFA